MAKKIQLPMVKKKRVGVIISTNGEDTLYHVVPARDWDKAMGHHPDLFDYVMGDHAHKVDTFNSFVELLEHLYKNWLTVVHDAGCIAY